MPMTAAGFPSLLRDLDCIVVNHLEPDHCASMVEVLALYQNCQIVSMEKSFMLMHSFGYDIDSHSQLQVQEGDSLSFGRHEVTFIEAPMVHWPEVMVALDLTDGVLLRQCLRQLHGYRWQALGRRVRLGPGVPR